MKMPPIITLNELSALYDVFFIDQFGVLRGGKQPMRAQRRLWPV